MKKPKPALVIVDMQPSFKAASCKMLLAQIAWEAGRIADTDGQVFLVLARESEGLIVPEIAMLGFDAIVRYKGGDDGGEVLLDDLDDFDEVRVCGVNRHHCVKATAETLDRNLACPVTILEHACGSPWGQDV